MKNKILSAEIYTDNVLVSKIIKELGYLYIEYDEMELTKQFVSDIL